MKATSEKILLVDDEPNVLQAYERLLHDRFEMETAVGPAEALTAIRTNGPYAVVLSDMKMPQMDGITFLRMLRNNHHWNHVPVVVFTGAADDAEMVEQAKELGVSDLVCKGANPAEALLGSVERILPHPKASRRESHQLVAM